MSRSAGVLLSGVFLLSAVVAAAAQEYVTSERPALPHPDTLQLGWNTPEAVHTSFPSIVPNIGTTLDGFTFNLGPAGAAALQDGIDGAIAMDSVLAAQAQAYADIKHVAEAIELATVEESLCGEDDSQHVEFYNGTGLVPRPFVDAHEPYTFVFRWRDDLTQASDLLPGTVRGKYWCTGSYIGNDQLLTAGHCFRSDDGSLSGFITPHRVTGILRQFLQPAEQATLMNVEFRYQIDGQTSELRQPVPFPVTRLVEYRNGGLDYAIVEVGPGADGRRLADVATPAQLGDSDAYPNQSVIMMIQHPNGEPKKVATGHILIHEEPRLLYDDLDTRGGSSGAGILTEDGRLIGVHTNGGCFKMSPGAGVRFANAGVAISAIRRVSNILPPP